MGHPGWAGDERYDSAAGRREDECYRILSPVRGLQCLPPTIEHDVIHGATFPPARE